jgi:hypothetical protein
VSAPVESVAGEQERESALTAASAAIGAFLITALALTWWRLFRGADLVDEAFAVLVPWRWALGDRPFVDEQNLSQSAGLLAYPFVKLYSAVREGDVAGLVLYERHLYLALAVFAAGCVFLLARRSLPASLAGLVAAPVGTVVLFETPQLTANTLGALLLVAGAALGAIAVLYGQRRYALYAGIAFGLACVAYPTVGLMMPFVGVFLAFSVGERTVAILARGSSLRVPPAETAASGPRAWRVLSAWTLGGVLVVAPVAALVVALAGVSNLRRCWDYTIALARQLDQLGGTGKAVEVAAGFVGLLFDQWYLVVAAAASLVVFRIRPGAGRWLLLLAPPALWVTATTSSLHAAGAVIAYTIAAPYLYLFVPAERRSDGARLLLWVWAPALLVGAMTAYTSADGFVHSAVGLLPGLVASGLFLAWGLAPLRRGGAASWPAVLGLGAVVLVTLVFQVQFQYGQAGWRDLSSRVESGPWRGIAVTPEQHGRLARFAEDLAGEARAGDRLLAYPQAAALYLYWPGEIAANTYQLYVSEADSRLPKATVSYYRRHREVPSLVAHVTGTAGKSEQRLQAECGGLAYPVVVVAPWYAIHRKPAFESVDDVLGRLPRL